MNTTLVQERAEATAMAGWLVFQAQRPQLALDDETATFVVQGFSGAGMAFAQIVFRHGLKVVAVADGSDGIYNPEGLPVAELVEHVALTGGVKDFWAGREMNLDELLALECGILVIGEADQTMMADEVLRVRAKGVLELVPDVVSPEVAEILRSRGIAVVV